MWRFVNIYFYHNSFVQIIVHAVGDGGQWSAAGVQANIAARYPAAEQRFQACLQKDQNRSLGDIQIVSVGKSEGINKSPLKMALGDIHFFIKETQMGLCRTHPY